MEIIKKLNDNKGAPPTPYYKDKKVLDKISQESDLFKKKWKNYSRGYAGGTTQGYSFATPMTEFKQQEIMEESIYEDQRAYLYEINGSPLYILADSADEALEKASEFEDYKCEARMTGKDVLKGSSGLAFEFDECIVRADTYESALGMYNHVFDKATPIGINIL